ncbi:hypothetical protein C0J52_19335 [Blattella germanica]|nr:hypothetical protein C0J52_19335 [Blattella germanica]
MGRSLRDFRMDFRGLRWKASRTVSILAAVTGFLPLPFFLNTEPVSCSWLCHFAMRTVIQPNIEESHPTSSRYIVSSDYQPEEASFKSKSQIADQTDYCEPSRANIDQRRDNFYCYE